MWNKKREKQVLTSCKNRKLSGSVCPSSERRLGPAGAEAGRLQAGGPLDPGEEVGEEGEAEEEKRQQRNHRKDQQGPEEGPRRSGTAEPGQEAEADVQRGDGGPEEEDEKRGEEEAEAQKGRSHLSEQNQLLLPAGPTPPSLTGPGSPTGPVLFCSTLLSL